MLAGADKKGYPLQRGEHTDAPMLAVTGESDTVLIGDFIPVALKLYEMLHAENPAHTGLSVMCGQLNVIYANAFIQIPADSLGDVQYDKKNSEYKRARLHYLRGRDYILDVFEKKYPGFRQAVLGNDAALLKTAVSYLKQEDVTAAYWCSAGALGAFSLDPLDPDLLGSIRGPVAVLERAAALAPDYSNGVIWDMLSAFYAGAPVEFGGNSDRALFCHEQAMRVSRGKTAGPYITYAESFCIPRNDEKGFETALNKALAINPDDNPSLRLSTIIFQNKARRLLAAKDDYFVHW
jgi:predicted anti-sigma-YlaC factor YlaD